MVRTIGAALAAAVLVAIAPGPARAGLTKGRVVETGQTTTYGAGSDGDLERGLSRSFVDLGNGVIKDQRTGLFWEKKSDDGSIHDKDNVYTWGAGFPLAPDAMNGTMVTTFISALNSQPCFAGSCDWRIPNRNELQSIVNLETYAPATFPVFNTGCSGGCTVLTCSCVASDDYWTTSTNRATSSGAWVVNFTYGSVFSDDKVGNQFSVRAVRGGF